MYGKKMSNTIDLVIPWVDGNDELWLKEKEKYAKTFSGDKRNNRFRDWDVLEYSFRGIEKFLPWIRKIHFITWGHVPRWLNLNHPKLNVVRHEDYIPNEYLPIFNSNGIEMNLHRIKELSQQFIYINDDMFFTSPTYEKDFFVNGLPCDSALECVHQFKLGGIDHIVASDLEVINDKFNKKQCIRENWRKYYSYKYGKRLLKNLYHLPFRGFTGFENPHVSVAYLKETFNEIWECYPEVLEKTSRNKFRTYSDVNQWLARYWQFATGSFTPSKPFIGRFFSIGKDDELIENAIKNQKYKVICLSDDNEILDFEQEKSFIKQCFEEILPEKSSFEV